MPGMLARSISIQANIPAEDIDLMSDIHELAALNLGVSPGDPRCELPCVQLGMTGEGGLDCMDNEVQKISFICRVSSLLRKDNPV